MSPRDHSEWLAGIAECQRKTHSQPCLQTWGCLCLGMIKQEIVPSGGRSLSRCFSHPSSDPCFLVTPVRWMVLSPMVEGADWVESPTPAPVGHHFPRTNSRKLFNAPAPKSLFVPSEEPSQAAVGRGGVIVFPVVGKGGFPGGQVPTSTVSHTKGFPEPGQEASAFPELPFSAYFKPPKDATGGKDWKTEELSMLGVVL